MVKDDTESNVGRSRSFSLITHHSSLITAFSLGAATVAGYAPFYLFPLPVITLAGLFYLWSRAPGPRAAAWIGFAFGLGLFLFGVSWVYVSLHDFGAMPMPLAAAATALFCAFLALFPALVGHASTRFKMSNTFRFGVLAPAAWVLAEWIRSWIFTGFPWLALGYSQVPWSPLAGYAPVLGIHGVTLATAVSAGLVVVLALGAIAKAQGTRHKAQEEKGHASTVFSFILHPSAFILLALWAGGFGLKQVEWTQPVGAPINISVLQGNVPQDLKWLEERVPVTLETYSALVATSSSPLIILPETALPLFIDQVPQDYLAMLAGHARKNGGDILIGVPERLPSGEYFNSVVSLGTAPSQTYRKSHLVPFGEFIPLRPVLGWIVSVLAIPLQDFSRGAESQRPLAVAGQRVAVNICYEDAFGEEIIRQLPEATLLVNVSNVAWFGRSIAPGQHLQISQARALETGRFMLRATNTGVTGVIGPDGRIAAAAPEFTLTAVTHRVQGYGGSTPYVRWGNYAALVLCLIMIAVAAGAGRRNSRSAA
ncbi:MAG TPA: apolipoprotein N-acyltransferase [Burkholderiales bacterium]|nr:apolipoprotein N-acyltransferase [Burkholderiales bacterium]